MSNYIKFIVCNSDWFVEWKKWSYSDYEDLFYKIDGLDWFHVWLFGCYCIIYRFNKKIWFDE